MERIDWMHCCEYAFTDQAGNDCLIGIYDRIEGEFPLKTMAATSAGNRLESLGSGS